MFGIQFTSHLLLFSPCLLLFFLAWSWEKIHITFFLSLPFMCSFIFPLGKCNNFYSNSFFSHLIHAQNVRLFRLPIWKFTFLFDFPFPHKLFFPRFKRCSNNFHVAHKFNKLLLSSLHTLKGHPWRGFIDNIFKFLYVLWQESLNLARI